MRTLKRKVREMAEADVPDPTPSLIAHLQEAEADIADIHRQMDAADQLQWSREQARLVTVVEELSKEDVVKRKWEHLLERQMKLDSWRIGDKINEHLHETELQLQQGRSSFPAPIKIRVLGGMLHLLEIQHRLRTDMVVGGQHTAHQATATTADTERLDSKRMKMYRLPGAISHPAASKSTPTLAPRKLQQQR